MVHPVQPSDATGPIAISQTPQERQRLFEIQFATEVLSAYVSITRQDGSVKQQLSKLKNGLASGQSPDQLAPDLNQVISQINSGIVPGKALFPPFSFSSGGSETQALANFCISLEKLLHTAGETGNIPWKHVEKIFGELSTLISNIGQMTSEQAFNKLNGAIEEANKDLPAQYTLPTIPFMHRR